MTDNLDIEILNVQNNPEGKLRQLSPQTETLVDIEKGIFVNLGIPIKNDAVSVPDLPHVFVADELRVQDKSHKDHPLLLKNTVVLIGHGLRNSEDQWKFRQGQDVVDTVNGYNKYANKEGMPEIEFLVVCNKDNTGISATESGLNRNTAYAAGSEINVSGWFEKNGVLKVTTTSNENTFNLDNLETSKQINFIE